MPKQLNALIWDKQPENWYVEPMWTAQRLFEKCHFVGGIHDPCCGMGTIPGAAYGAGYRTTCADIVDRRPDPLLASVSNFSLRSYKDETRMFDNIVTNPPFDDVNSGEFVDWAIAHATYAVALLVPFKWFGGDKRSRFLEQKPIRKIYVLTPRPSMPPGEVVASGEKPGGGKEDFAWTILMPMRRKMVEEPAPLFGWLHRDG